MDAESLKVAASQPGCQLLEACARLQFSKIGWATDRVRTGLHLLHKQTAYLNASNRHKTEGAVHFCRGPLGVFLRCRDVMLRHIRRFEPEMAHGDITG